MAIEHISVDLRSLWKAPKYSGGNTSAGHTVCTVKQVRWRQKTNFEICTYGLNLKSYTNC